MHAYTDIERARLLELGHRLRVLGDRLIVKRIQYEHPVLAVVGVELQKGLIIAAGSGRRLRRKTPFKQASGHFGGEVIWFEDGAELGTVRPLAVGVGDVVEFSPRNQLPFVFDGTDCWPADGFHAGEELISIKEQAVYWRTDDSPSDGLMFQQSAGFDRKGNFLSGAEQWQQPS
jgi:hypothetical protein